MKKIISAISALAISAGAFAKGISELREEFETEYRKGWTQTVAFMNANSGDIKAAWNAFKCLPVRKFAEYAALFTLEPEMAGLCTDLTPAEVDMLSAEDSGRIFEKAHELNFAPFSAWLGRKTKAAEMIAQAYGASLPQKESNPKGEDSANSPLGL